MDYKEILDEHMLNVFKDILHKIKDEGLSNNHQLYVTFSTKNSNIVIPKWLLKKYPDEMTIIIQYEYYNIEIKKNFFLIILSFNNIKTDLKISFDSIISFADPSSNFGLNYQLNNSNKKKEKKEKRILKKNKKENEKSNVLKFSKLKKN